MSILGWGTGVYVCWDLGAYVVIGHKGGGGHGGSNIEQVYMQNLSFTTRIRTTTIILYSSGYYLQYACY